MHRIKVRYK